MHVGHPETLPEPECPEPEVRTDPGAKWEKPHLWRLRPLPAYPQSSSTEMELNPLLLPGPGWGLWVGAWDTDILGSSSSGQEAHEGATRQTAHSSQIGFPHLAGLSYRMGMNEEQKCTETAPRRQVSVAH